MSFPMTQWRYIGELNVTSASSEGTMYSGVHVCIVHMYHCDVQSCDYFRHVMSVFLIFNAQGNFV